MVQILEYQDDNGGYPFFKWINSLDTRAKLKIRTAIARMENNNFSNIKAVGSGVSEYKIDFGPGYRIYFGKDDETLIILLGGGTKKRQSKDIQNAQDRWKNYKRRKTRGQ